MAYTPTVWKNGEFPPIDAEHLNKIEQGIADAVSVTAQSLTDDQKTQARGNINAAPGGFGLGGGAKQISSWDDARENGWYYGPAPAGIGSGNLWGRVDSLSDGYAVQTIYSDNHVATAERFFISPAWKPWEWIDPPMQLGDEYRTTERHFGKPVYCQIVNFGYGPNNSHAHITKTIENLDTIVRWSGTSSDGTAFPFTNHMVSPAAVLDGIVYRTPNVLHIDLYTNENKSNVELYVSVFYTKNSD